MALEQSVRKSDLEKRLKILRSQVYGKQSYFIEPSKTEPANHSSTITSDLHYLNKDLLKILTLAATALGSEVLLYFLLQSNLLNFYR